MSTIRLGTASPATQATTEATLRDLAQLARRAASQNIDILLLPEAYLGGYPRGATFGAKIGSRTDEGKEEFARYFEQAVDLGDTVGNGAGAGVKWVKKQLRTNANDGDDDDSQENGQSRSSKRGDGTREELEKIASDTGVFIVTGCVERAGGTLYCAVVYVCPKKGILGKRRKVMPTGMERLCWGQGCPSTLRAVSTTIRGTRINLAAAICWENYMPLLRQSLYAQNINLYLAPTADARDTWLSLMRTVGCEGRCFVVSSNMAVRGRENDNSSSDSKTSPNDNDPPQLQRQQRERERSPTATRRTGRRNSTITEDGFEIALPSPSIKSQSRQASARRASVIVDDGNEIVLCADKTSPPLAAKSPMPNGGAAASRLTSKLPDTQESPSWDCRGGSSIVSPTGEVLAGPQWEDDHGLIYADVDFRDCIKGRLDLDAAGSYSRNDSFRFSVAGLDLDPLPY